jgi:hypothetical protein
MISKVTGSEVIQLDDLLVDLKLPPSAANVPVPRYFIDERRTELEDRENLLVGSFVPPLVLMLQDDSAQKERRRRG